MDQNEDRISGLKNKVDALEQKQREKYKEVQIKHARPLGCFLKTKLMNYGHRRKRSGTSYRDRKQIQ
jgi:hypothetical protein